jgi:hypothetical protein
MKKYWYYVFIVILAYSILGFAFTTLKNLDPYAGSDFNLGYFIAYFGLTALMIFGIYKCVKKIREKKS